MISDMCDKLGADKYKVLNSVGGDSRIGNKYFNPGYSFGGPCFPRDTKALKLLVDKVNINSDILTATTKYNEEHIKLIKERRYRYNPNNKSWNITLNDEEKINEEKNWLTDNIYNGTFKGIITMITVFDKYKDND